MLIFDSSFRAHKTYNSNQSSQNVKNNSKNNKLITINPSTSQLNSNKFAKLEQRTSVVFLVLVFLLSFQASPISADNNYGKFLSS